MKTIAVIRAGTMGNGIAHTFAQSGFTVKLIDVSEQSLDKGMATIAANLDRIAKGTITEEDKAKTITNIITYTDIKDGVVGVDLVVEAATENVELKIFSTIE
jgi:3-hydroxybutyryl-CoA dehydrogenase